MISLQLSFLFFKKPTVVTEPVVPLTIPKQLSINVSDAKPSYLSYEKLINFCKKWESEVSDVVTLKTYGKSSQNKDLYYIRINNKNTGTAKPIVFITGCIHGNEPLSTATIMWYIGSLLNDYNSDPQVKELVDNRDLYFIPVVSPDSYPSSRYVDGVDPNRNFPNLSEPDRKSVVPIAALQNLYLQLRPKAVLSGHTYGRVFLTPHGDTMQECKDHDAFIRVVGKMAELSGYKNIRACELYGTTSKPNDTPTRIYGENNSSYKVKVPIYGTEIDWYYRNGSFAIVMEFGTHQRKPSYEDIEYEFKRTWKSFLYFLKEAPLVDINPETMTVLSLEPNLHQDFRDE